MTFVDAKPDAAISDGHASADAATEQRAGSSLQSSLERLQELDSSGLREEWRRLCRSEPPRISRDLLSRALAYRLQESEFGGLPKWARQSLAGSRSAPTEVDEAPTPKPAQPLLKPGARLVREWHGRTHSVIVLDDAFEFEGKRYGSLTQIAREITGAHWSGPRFFGLVKRSAEAKSNGPSTHQDGPEEAVGLAPSGLGTPSIGARRDAAYAGGEDARLEGRRAKESARG
jgi:hypothetical protein